MLAASALMYRLMGLAQTPASVPKFEVAAIMPCKTEIRLFLPLAVCFAVQRSNPDSFKPTPSHQGLSINQ
jgi:hypothetical protein